MSQPRRKTFVVRREPPSKMKACPLGKHREGDARCEAFRQRSYSVKGFEMCAAGFERLTGLVLRPGESARVRLVRVGKRRKG